MMAVGVVLLHFGCNYYLGQFCKHGPTTLSLRVFSLLNDGSPLLLIGLSARYCSMYRMTAKKKTTPSILTYQTPTKNCLISYPTRLSSSPCCHPIKSFILVDLTELLAIVSLYCRLILRLVAQNYCRGKGEH